MNTVTLAVQCHRFQRRLCWVVSSLLGQTSRSLVRLDVAYMPGDGDPSTERVLDAAAEWGLHVKRSPWTDLEAFSKRGDVRTRQLRECSTPWILFTDADMVYHPEYFERLVQVLQSEHNGASYLISGGRLSTDLDKANALVAEHDYRAGLKVNAPFQRALEVAQRRIRAPGGYGNSQIVHAQHGAHRGCYVVPGRNPDWGWGPRGQNTRSDVKFRRRMRVGGPLHPLPEWFSSAVVHLNHSRDKDAGTHVTEQR